MKWSEQILSFIDWLPEVPGDLPDAIEALNPWKGNGSENALRIAHTFYENFYHDTNPRVGVFGINPGRLGAGATGIPFTDSKKLEQVCGISPGPLQTHEPSSVFMYEVIEAMGGPEAFYGQFYISSLCPIGFVKTGNKSNRVNFNFYDNPALQEAVLPFMVEAMWMQIEMGLKRSCAICLGAGKNIAFFREWNKQHGFFDQILPLEHPRYIMQYRARQKHAYLNKYLQLLQQAV